MKQPLHESEKAFRVLVAEDDALCAMELAAMLDDMGCKVVGPLSDVAGLLAVEEPVDCALLDVNLGGVWSYDAAQALLDAGIPVVFVTGYAALPECPPQLADRPILGKPFNTAEVAAAMESMRAAFRGSAVVAS